MKFYKTRKKIAKIKYQLKIYAGFPHVYVTVLIFIITLVALFISLRAYWKNENLIFSISSNIFAGLLTGLILCLIGGTKKIFVVRVKSKKAYLEKLGNLLKDYFKLKNELLKKNFQGYDGTEELFSFIYDVGSHANWVNDFILQSSFEKNLFIDSIDYCKKHFDYDALALVDVFEDLHINLCEIDIEYPSKKQILAYFNEVDKHLGKLKNRVTQELSNVNIMIEST